MATTTIRDSYTLSLVVREIRRQWRTMAVITALMVLGTASNLSTPLLLRQLIDSAILAGDTRQLTLLLLLLLTILPIVDVGLALVRNYSRASVGEAVSRQLRKRLFDHLVHGRLNDVERTKIGHIVFVITRSCGRVGDVFVAQTVVVSFYHSIIITVTAAIMFALNWQLALIAMLAFPPSYLIARVAGRREKRLIVQNTDIYSSGESYLNEVFNNIKSVKSFNGERREMAWYEGWTRSLWRNKAKTTAHHDLFRFGYWVTIQNIVRGLMFGYGAFEVTNGGATIGDLVAFVAYVPGLYQATQRTLDLIIEGEVVKASAEKIDDLMSFPREDASHGTVELSDVEDGASVEFSNVSFRYEREGFGIENLSFHTRANEFVGIVGPTGGGKSTVLELVQGFYEPARGRILIDGVDIRDLSIGAMRKQISAVPQDAFLWNDTIVTNIVYPNEEPNMVEVERVVREAQLEKFVVSLPSRYYEVVGQKGVDLSGGERQRIAIARALYKRARIVLLDEPTSALDALTESQLAGAIRRLREHSTLIVVAHRLKTVIETDKILVIDGGRIVESGAPDVLRHQGGLFTQMYEAQSLIP